MSAGRKPTSVTATAELSRFMARALELAEKGRGKTSPNPMVGAVVVKRGKIIGEGYHQRAGGPHAEVLALRKAGKAAHGADLLVTLEPCCHTGRTPPCTERIIAAGIKQVTAATLDPNPQMRGKSMKLLKRAGIATQVGLMRREAERLIEVHRKTITTGLPWVTLKAAITLDGFISAADDADLNLEQRWITSQQARRRAHELRAEHDAIMVGVGTVLADNPRLSCRLGRRKVRQPLKLVIDPALRTPTDAAIFSSGRVLLYTSPNTPAKRVAQLTKRGAEVTTLPFAAPTDMALANGQLDIAALLGDLGDRGVASVLVEGGAQTHTHFLRQHAADKLVLMVAPKLIGSGQNKCNINIFNDLGVTRLDHAFTLQDLSAISCGPDLVVEAYPQRVKNH